MRGHLEALHEQGAEAICALWASEAGIYGRWGYGPATRAAELTIDSRDARLRAPAPERPRGAAPPELLPEIRAVYEAVWHHRPGMVARGDVFWDEAISDFEHRRTGEGRLRAVVCDGGYALFAVRSRETEGRPDAVVVLRELIAATPAAAAVLWDHLLGLALTRSVHWALAPADEPLAHMVGDARALRARVADGLYVRLVDVARALARRTYAAPVDVVLELEDPVCPWNAGRRRLAGDASGATCEPTSAPADLALGVTELGAAYLGGTPLAALAAAGRVEERTAGALGRASHALAGVREPWCAQPF